VQPIRQEPLTRDELLQPGGFVGVLVPTGHSLRLIDVEGGQVADLFAFRADDPRERLSMYFSRAINLTWKLSRGHTLISTGGNPMWTIDEDSLGDNYSGGGYCNPRVNFARYGVRESPTCEANAAAALAPWGLDATSFDADNAFNVFMNVAYDPDGRWEIRDPRGRAGESITLRSTMDQIVAISNCPQLFNRCNGGRLKPLRVQVRGG
jgi:uncharacterized protein